ncbi:MAG: hypothetical protein MR294_04815 [Bacteroidales bacterium]|nr:hypothetical protein [Bacteroidales bacterium]
MWTLLSMIPLFPLVVSDFRRREVDVGWLLCFGVVVAAVSVIENSFGTAWRNVVGGLALYSVMGAFLFLYSKVRKMTVASMLGGGDVLFCLFITPFFEVRELVLFLVISFSLTLFVWIVFKRLHGGSKEIPLVGGAGLCLAIYLMFKTLFR